MTGSISKKVNLRIPGPVPLPDDILDLVGSQMINHRGPEYAEMIARMTQNLQTAFSTKNDAYFITASGTGGMETAIVNTISPGDKVLSIIIGSFGRRFAEIAEAYGAEVTRLEFDLGQAADLEQVRTTLRGIPNCKAVILTHNESSTGVTNPLQDIAEIVHEDSTALILVDAVSSAGGTPLPVDGWGIDVVATASQKSWVAPPGIAMVTFSQKAWDAYQESTSPKYYFDVMQYKSYLEIGQPPFTPCLPAIFALDHSLQAMIAEGMENVFARHHERAEQARQGARRLGLEILPDEKFASNTVTAVKIPEGIDGNEFVKRVRVEHGVVLGGGQQTLAGKIFRIGHMGWVEPEHIDEALNAVEQTLESFRA
ncbi:MAG: alanine--glyoxylate aminotransferase family protein [Dehalococcoidia bacterium]